MSDPVDFLTLGTDAVFAALDGAALGKPVFHSLPQNIQPDYVHIAELTTDTSSSSKWGQTEVLNVEIHTVVRGMNRQDLHALMHRQRLVLDQKILTVPGAVFGDIRLLKAWSPRPIDGLTRIGIALYEVTGQPA